MAVGYESDFFGAIANVGQIGLGGAAQHALISHTNTSVVVDTPVAPDPGDSLYEECLATQGPGPWEVIQTPQRAVERIGELPVTDEMIAAARQANSGGRGSRSWAECIAEIYRAMAGLDAGGLTVPEIRALLAERDARIAVVEAENAELLRLMGVQNAWIAELNAKLAAFGDPTPADLPDPPRRPDGTLVPQAKPFPVVKSGGDPRRIGG